MNFYNSHPDGPLMGILANLGNLKVFAHLLNQL